jgi:hypothetical protein
MTDDEAPQTVGRPPLVIRIACILLMVLGFGSVAISATPAADPSGSRCRLSRERLDRANTDSKPWNNVDTGGKKAKDLSCPDVIRLVGQIKLSEKGTKTDSAPSETAVRVQGILGVLLGLGQGISGSLVARRMSRPTRNTAVAFSAFGLVFPILGPISFALSFFAIYALVFSAPAKQLWGRDAAS